MKIPAFRFFDLLPEPLPITIIDVGAASIGGHTDPYHALLAYPNVRVIGFEPNEQSCAERTRTAPPTHQFLPVFIGDGRRRTFYECENPLTSSLFSPDASLLAMFQRMDLPVVSTREVETRRLDDVLKGEDADLLKLDVQGAELDVLRGAAETLEAVTVVHTEVEFIPIYKDQPLFGDVDVHLRASGFWFHNFVGVFSRQLKPLVLNNDIFHEGSQLIYADAAIFLRTLDRLHTLQPEKLLKMAAITHDVYRGVDMTCAIVAAHDRVTGLSLLPSYLEKLGIPLRAGNL
jgi:FkbM family methyltransferase